MDSDGLITDGKQLYYTKANSEMNKNFQEQLMMSIMQDSDDEDAGSASPICLITHEPLNEYTDDDIFTLSCCHTFLKSALFKEVCQQKEQYTSFKSHYFSVIPSRYFLCPYCREKHNKPFPTWIGFPIIPRVNGVRKKAGQSYCMYEHTKGKKKGQYCAKTTDNEYCIRHQNIMDTNVTEDVYLEIDNGKCQAILKSGAKKGTVCGNKAKYEINDMSFCGRHKNYSI